MLESFQRVQWRDWLSDYMFFNNPEKKLESDYMFFNNPEKKQIRAQNLYQQLRGISRNQLECSYSTSISGDSLQKEGGNILAISERVSHQVDRKNTESQQSEPQTQKSTRAFNRIKKQTRIFGVYCHAVNLVDLNKVPVSPGELAQPAQSSQPIFSKPAKVANENGENIQSAIFIYI